MLSWIANCKNIKKCVRQRIGDIHALVPEAKWFHIKGTLNPSDYLTRGISNDEFRDCNLWFYGPEFSVADEYVKTGPLTLEDICSAVVSVSDVRTKEIEDLLSRFGDYSRMIRVFKLVFRFIDRLFHRNSNISVFEAEVRIVGHLQAAHFTDVQRYFADPANIKIPNLVKQLNLIADRGIVKCAGRMRGSNLSDGAKFPILLPTNSSFTNMLIDFHHLINLHAGINYVLSSIRNKFWIVKGRQRVKSRINKCITCKRYQARPISMPTVAQFPKFRVEDSSPFKVCGVDYTGPFNVKHSQELHKVWICLFTCMSTRGVHLELVGGADTETFILAFHRFIARKSCPSLMISDNAQIFRTASEHLSRYRIEWKFIPARAPHFGGVWERMIGITKLCMKKILGRNLVSQVELETILCQIECQINNRPLTYISDDVNDHPVTPAMLLYGRNIELVADEYFDFDELCDPSFCNSFVLSKRYLYVQSLICKSWDNWKNEYVKSLRERDRNLIRNNHPLRVGDIVLIWDESPRSRWNLGRVEELFVGTDKIVRAAKLKTKNGSITRPLIKLINLEIRASTTTDAPSTCQRSENVTKDRPRRQAASRALEALKRIDY